MIDPNSFPGNSRTRPASKESPRPKVAPVTHETPVMRQGGVFSRIKQAFVVTDSKTLLWGVVDEVLVPKIRDLIYETFNDTILRGLYGDRGIGGGRYTGYRQSSRQAPRYDSYGSPERVEDVRTRNVYDYQYLTFATLDDAARVSDRLVELTREYGSATVADFYDAAGVSSSIADASYGWTQVNGAPVRRGRDGFVLSLPRPVQLSKL